MGLRVRAWCETATLPYGAGERWQIVSARVADKLKYLPQAKLLNIKTWLQMWQMWQIKQGVAQIFARGKVGN
jgi:hypothetical protein